MEINMKSIKRRAAAGLFLAGGALTVAAAVHAQSGSAAKPIVVHMKRGSDSILLHGVLRQGVDCCTYKFAAAAGQHLQVTETGAVVRLLLAYPDGHTDGPGLPQDLLLPARGTYLLTVSPDTMANGAFGKFSVRITIPPLGMTPGTSVNGDKPF
jgi:hypothetical protein